MVKVIKENGMNLDDYKKDNGTATTDLQSYNEHLKVKKMKKALQDKQEALEIEAQMTDDILLDMSN